MEKKKFGTKSYKTGCLIISIRFENREMETTKFVQMPCHRHISIYIQ